MNENEKKLTENRLIEDFIKLFGVKNILSKISDIDIANCCDESVLSCIDDMTLVKSLYDVDDALKYIDDDKIIVYLNTKGYEVTDTLDEECTILNTIKSVCKEIQPKGYIGKEDAKKMICRYIDDWMDKGFC